MIAKPYKHVLQTIIHFRKDRTQNSCTKVYIKLFITSWGIQSLRVKKLLCTCDAKVHKLEKSLYTLFCKNKLITLFLANFEGFIGSSWFHQQHAWLRMISTRLIKLLFPIIHKKLSISDIIWKIPALDPYGFDQ